MGNLLTVTSRGEGSLKLEAQKIKEFTGSYDDWQKWKSRTICAFSGSGYEKILESEGYALTHKKMNKVVFAQLVAATVDGTAYHLVQEYDDTKNGHAAWKNLIKWFDGDMVMNETAENLRVKLDHLKLSSSTTGSHYVNKFLAWHRDLQKIPGEGYTPNHAVYLLLKNISHPDYKDTVTFCKNTNATLEEAISAIRKQEQSIHQARLEKRSNIRPRRTTTDQIDDDYDEEDYEETTPKRRKAKIRRTDNETVVDSNNEKFEGELKTTEKGLLRFHGRAWQKLEDKQKEFVREYNSKVKHGEPLDTVEIPNGITISKKIRRMMVKKEEDKEPISGTTKKKRIGFNLDRDETEDDAV